MSRNFLTAEWRKLVMANYEVDPAILEEFVPPGTELDLWNGVCFVSLVGFMFQNTKLMGISVPFHINFEEVNLRFYVRYFDDDKWKRGVVFIKEIVPKAALTLVANTLYGENYETMPMEHKWVESSEALEVEYKWRKHDWNSFKVLAGNSSVNFKNGSEEEFITEHYWGYTKLRTGGTSEYGVEHPKWQVYPVKDYQINVDFGSVYGAKFKELSNDKPLSVFLAEGSEIVVKKGRKL